MKYYRVGHFTVKINFSVDFQIPKYLLLSSKIICSTKVFTQTILCGMISKFKVNVQKANTFNQVHVNQATHETSCHNMKESKSCIYMYIPV